MEARHPPEPPAAAGLLQLVFSGEYLPGFDKPTVRLTVERTLELDAAHSAHLFSGQRVVLGQGLDATEAARYVEQFARMGALLRMEPDPGPPDPPQPPALAAAAPPRRHAGLLLAGIVVVAGLALWALRPRPAPPPVRAPAAAQPGPGPAPNGLSQAAADALAGDYALARVHKAFAVSGDLAFGWKAGAATPEAAAEGALRECAAQRPSYAPACKVINTNGGAVD